MRYALVLAGGSGTRLWPLSRDARPKQLIPLDGGRSLLEEAYERTEGLVPPGNRIVCGAERHRAAVIARIPGLAGTDAPGGGTRFPRYVGEPVGRDTLPAIAYCCALILREDPDASVLVLTSDHVIRPAAGFRRLAAAAFALVESDPGLLVTFGVRPDRAATGFGYLELGDPLPGAADPAGAAGAAGAEGAGAAAAEPRIVARFREKPDQASATAYFDAGPRRFLWNSGMFVWKAGRLMELVERYQAPLRSAIRRLVPDRPSGTEAALLAELYPTLTRTSVDYGIMEHASADPGVVIAALPLEMEWKDIGSWTAYGSLAQPDAEGNASIGGASIFVESAGNLAVSSDPSHFIACLGCEDLVIVHTPDATLVCPKSRADDLKKLHTLVSPLDGGRLV